MACKEKGFYIFKFVYKFHKPGMNLMVHSTVHTWQTYKKQNVLVFCQI